MSIIYAESQSPHSNLSEESIVAAINHGGGVNLEELYNLVGYPGIANLIEYYNGDTVYIPKCTSILSVDRNQKMLDYYMECRDYKKTSRAFGVTVKTVYNVIGSFKELKMASSACK